MATFEVTRETITVHPHPNADRLELAQVGLYRVVVVKDQYHTGESVLYIPEYAVLPENLIAELGLEGKLAGPQANRVKPVKLRGELSQGLVAPLSTLPADTSERQDYAEVLGITKWEPEIPSSMSGDVEGNYNLVSWIDVENLKKFPDMFATGEDVVITEKIHGTATLFTFYEPGSSNEQILVSSKGLGERKLVLKEDERNVYWKVLHAYKLDNFARQIAARIEFENTVFDGPTYESPQNTVEVSRVALFGETYGSKIQDLHYGKSGGELGFALFDIYVEYVSTDGSDNRRSVNRWLDSYEVNSLAAEFGVQQVPVLFDGPFNIEQVAELASGKEQVSGRELHIREGVVVRPARRDAGYEAGAQKIGKYVSDAYLLRKGGTEYS